MLANFNAIYLNVLLAVCTKKENVQLLSLTSMFWKKNAVYLQREYCKQRDG